MKGWRFCGGHKSCHKSGYQRDIGWYRTDPSCHTHTYIYIYIKSWQVSKVDFVWRGALVWACPGLMATGGFSPKVFRRWNSPNWHPKLLNKNGALPSLPWHVPISPQKKRKAHHSMAQCVHRFFIAFQSLRFSSSFLDDWDHVSIICLCFTALPKNKAKWFACCICTRPGRTCSFPRNLPGYWRWLWGVCWGCRVTRWLV